MPTVRAQNFRRSNAGLKNALRCHLLNVDEFSVMQNLKPGRGNLVKRGGTIQQGDAPDAAVVRMLLHTYDDISGLVTNRLRLCNGKIQYLTGGAWTNVKTGLSTTLFGRWVQYQDKVWWCNGTSTPQKITLGAVPSAANWTTMPVPSSTINPSLVTLHKNRIYIGGDTTLPTYVYMSNPGDPTTFTITDFYQVPDNQSGFAPQELKSFGEWIGIFCEDYACNLSGVGPLTHRLTMYPKGAALICARTVVDMGGYAIYHTDKGCAVWDGYGKPELLDPGGEVNWDDFDLTTPNNTWAMKWSDREYAIFYKSKGTPTAPTGATYLATSTARSSLSIYYALRSRLTLAAATGDTQTAHYLLYDTVLRQWSGPHTGNWLCGDMESYRNSDRQVPWVGDSTTAGVVAKAEQTTFSDLGTTYETILRTGSLYDATTRVGLDKLKLLFGAQNAENAKAEVQLYWEGRAIDPAHASWEVNLSGVGPQGEDAGGYPEENERTDFVLARLYSQYKDGRFKGFQPVIEIHEKSTEPYEIRAIEGTFTPAPEEQEGR